MAPLLGAAAGMACFLGYFGFGVAPGRYAMYDAASSAVASAVASASAAASAAASALGVPPGAVPGWFASPGAGPSDPSSALPTSYSRIPVD
jgi:hypothetical protein